MKNFSLLLLSCLLLGAILAGCTGMVDSSSERYRRYEQIEDINRRQLVDDWDYLWLNEKNSRLTQWHPRVGE